MKKNDKNYSILLTLFVISIVIANVVGSRTITTGIHLGPITLSTSGARSPTLSRSCVPTSSAKSGAARKRRAWFSLAL